MHVASPTRWPAEPSDKKGADKKAVLLSSGCTSMGSYFFVPWHKLEPYQGYVVSQLPGKYDELWWHPGTTRAQHNFLHILFCKIPRPWQDPCQTVLEVAISALLRSHPPWTGTCSCCKMLWLWHSSIPSIFLNTPLIPLMPTCRYQAFCASSSHLVNRFELVFISADSSGVTLGPYRHSMSLAGFYNMCSSRINMFCCCGYCELAKSQLVQLCLSRCKMFQ